MIKNFKHQSNMENQVKDLIKIIKTCAKTILDELGPGWKEDIFQNAMEVALRDKGIMYETQRTLPISFSGHVIGEVYPDLVVWLKNDGKKVGLVVDLKAEAGIKEEFTVQAKRYIKELKKQVRGGESIYPKALLINFIREQNSVKLKEGFEDLGGIQVLEVSG